jgi:chemotaxis protein histidine kinase CheA
MAETVYDPEFETEALGCLDTLEREVRDWSTHCSAESLKRVFRSMHSLKGAAGFAGHDGIESMAHAMEELIATCADANGGPLEEERLGRLCGMALVLRRELGESGRAKDVRTAARQRALAGDAFVTLLRQGRRMAAEYGKQVQVCLSGTNVGLEPHVVESLRGPLGHLIRNAVAHAVEPPDVRAARGKPYFATILVEVEQRATELHVRIHDDGQGFDLGALERRVLRRGLAAEAATRSMNAAELAQLAFLPGVSTASEISSLSGRGVGLEAARAVIEAAGGTLELSTEALKGTTVSIRMPQRAASPRPDPRRSDTHRLATR